MIPEQEEVSSVACEAIVCEHTSSLMLVLTSFRLSKTLTTSVCPSLAASIRGVRLLLIKERGILQWLIM